VLPGLSCRLQVARAVMGVCWRNYALGGNGCCSMRMQGNLMASRMRGSRPDISYVMGRCVKEDAEGRVTLRACIEGHIDAENVSLASV
jgi:hypothetical protein